MDEYKYNGYKPNEEMLIEINSLKAANKTLSEELQAVSETKRGLAMSLAEEVGRVDGLKKHIAEKEEELVFIDRELKSAESRYQAEMGKSTRE